MRSIPMFLLLGGCGLVGPVTDSGSDSNLTCARTGWKPAVAATMSFQQLIFDQGTLLPNFESGAEYGELGAAACHDPSSNKVEWIFESGGEPLGSVYMDTDETGNVDLVGLESYFEIRFIGDATAYGYANTADFGSNHFLTGSWQVDSTEPLTVRLTGDANNAGHFLTLDMSATMTRE